MNERQLFRTRLSITSVIAIGIWMLLAWEHAHGGVASHHLLQRADMPAISNWWGGLLLPVLSWFLLGRIHRRSARRPGRSTGAPMFPPGAAVGCAGALLYGVLLSAFFSHGYSDLTSYMFQSLLLLALFLPIYRAEYVLGFVLGMTVTFGAVLPTIAGSLVAGIAAVIYRYLRPAVLRAAAWFVRSRVSTTG